MKKAIHFYLKRGADPRKYGFVWCESQRGNYWAFSIEHNRSVLFIDPDTRQITCNLSWSSHTVATLVKMGEDKAIILDDDNDPERSVLMRLSPEEAEAIRKMRAGGSDE